MSWNSSTLMVRRPEDECRSSFSASSLATMAVEDMEKAAPSARPPCQGMSPKWAMAIVASMVTTTWTPPRPNTCQRMAMSRVRENSRPMENIRKTTPNSARREVCSLAGSQPSACGPTTMPMAR